MPLWSCDHNACSRSAVRTYGACVLCNRHLCIEHLAAAYHKCPKWEDERLYDPAMREAEDAEVNRLLARINIPALAQAASRLRNGIGCTIPSLHYDRATRVSVMGGMNYHVEIRFDDGVVWLARIRRFNATSPPLAVQNYIIRSEVATLRFLERTNVPAPQVYGYALASDDSNKAGVGYILLEKLQGRSLNRSKASESQLRKVIAQLADIYLELDKYPFRTMGSLDQPNTDHLGPFASELLTDCDGSKIAMLGPCLTVEEFHTLSVRRILDLTISKEMYADQAIDAYLIHRFLLDLIPKISTLSTQAGRFFLKHSDDKGDHILVDDEYNITGIIDWEWASTAPAEVAFNSPVLLLPVAEFYDGEQNISREESYLASCLEGRSPELANAVRLGRIQHFFAFCCGYDLSDWRGFVGLFRGLRDAARVDEGIDWDEWKARALKRYHEDERLVRLLRDHAQTETSNELHSKRE